MHRVRWVLSKREVGGCEQIRWQTVGSGSAGPLERWRDVLCVRTRVDHSDVPAGHLMSGVSRMSIFWQPSPFLLKDLKVRTIAR